MYLSRPGAAHHLPYFKYFEREGRVDTLPSTTRKILGARTYQTLWTTYRWLKHEQAAVLSGRSRPRFDLWRRGFFSDSAIIYDFPRNDPRHYLSDFEQIRLGGLINDWDGLFNHKIGLRAFLLAKGYRQTETVAFVYEGRILAQPFDGQASYMSGAELEELLRSEGPGAGWLIKPEAGRQGQGVFLLEHTGHGFHRRRGRDTTPFDLRAFLATLQPRHNRGHNRATLIERRLQQGAFWRGLFPDSANTMRLLTLWTPGEAAPFIARAVQRIGTADTVPTDNWSGGGISAPIDTASGRLGAGRMHPLKGPPRSTSSRLERLAPLERHPDSGAQIAGAVLPGWDRVADVVLRAAASLPFNRMAGWDVLVDAEGEPVILEANGNSDVNLLQVHGGLLTDPRARRFYESFGVGASAG